MAFPSLEVLDQSAPHQFLEPLKMINDGPDITHFLSSKAYRDIGVFVVQLNHAMCPRKTSTSTPRTFPLAPQTEKVGKEDGSEAGVRASDTFRRLQGLLSKAASFIDEAPPDPGPRRFGNLSFRKWFQLLKERAEVLLEEFLPAQVLVALGALSDDNSAAARQEILAYLLGGFGSDQRLDYGTGHELSFLAFLGCLWKLGAFKSDVPAGEVERGIVLDVLEPYFRLVRKLILTYTLEPAGSHGVWGLDDHSFLPYIFGSAQLTRPITDSEPTPLEGSVPNAPGTGDIVKADVVNEMRRVNMYFSAVGFINDVKKGPFWEHSPVLYDISGVRDGWGKINKGMIRMFNAEVLSKFPVVQHFRFGSLFSWDLDPEAQPPLGQSVHVTSLPDTHGAPSSSTGTTTPRNQASRVSAPPGAAISHSRAPPPPESMSSDIPGAVPGAMQLIRDASVGAGSKPESTAPQITVTKAPWAK